MGDRSRMCPIVIWAVAVLRSSAGSTTRVSRSEIMNILSISSPPFSSHPETLQDTLSSVFVPNTAQQSQQVASLGGKIMAVVCFVVCHALATAHYANLCIWILRNRKDAALLAGRQKPSLQTSPRPQSVFTPQRWLPLTSSTFRTQ